MSVLLFQKLPQRPEVEVFSVLLKENKVVNKYAQPFVGFFCQPTVEPDNLVSAFNELKLPTIHLCLYGLPVMILVVYL